MSALGEAVFALPLLHALKNADPPWRTVCVVGQAGIEILGASGLADVVILRRPGAGGFIRLLSSVRRARPGICLALSASASNCILARLSGARRRVGYRHAAIASFLETVPFEGGGVENYLSLLAPLGIARTVVSYCGLLHVPDGTQRQADSILAAEGIDPLRPFIAVSPISTGKLGVKAYPIESWRAVCDGLREIGWPLVLVGSSDDSDVHRQMLSDGGTKAASLAGKTTPLVLAGALRRAACAVGVDTGPIHVAAAVGTRCVTLFGPSDPARTAPCGGGHINLSAGLDCQPCLAAPCEHNGACMRMIEPAAVVNAVRTVLSEQGT